MMTKRSQPQTIEYAFRFARGTQTERTRMVEMIRVNLHELVKRIILTHAGYEVDVDGFRLREEPDITYALEHPVAETHNTRA
jgi:hypothetical protein